LGARRQFCSFANIVIVITIVICAEKNVIKKQQQLCGTVRQRELALQTDTSTFSLKKTRDKVSKVKGQGKLNTRICSESVLMLFTKNYQNQSVPVETTAC